MRKFLKVAAIGALAILVATPAMALDFKFGAEYRVRLYSAVNNGFTDGPNTAVRGAQLRVRPRFDVTDDNKNIAATLRLEIGDVEFGNGGGANGVTNGVALAPGSNRVGNGSGGSLGADGVNIETKWAYMDFAMPFGWDKYGRVRAGIQPWFLSKGLLVDDDAAGIRAYGTIKPVSYDLAWYRISGGVATNGASTVLLPCTGGAFGAGGVGYVQNAAACTALGGVAGTAITATGSLATPTVNNLDNNHDFYQAKFDFAVAKAFNPGFYYLYGNNKVVDSESHYFGLTAAGKLGIVDYDLDFIYGTAQAGQYGAASPATKGFVIDGHVGFPVGPVKVNLAASYASGDSQNGRYSEALPYIAPSWNGAGGGFELIGSGGAFDATEFTQDYPANLFMVGGWVEYVPVKALWLKAAYGYAAFAKKTGNCASTPKVAGSGCFGPTYTGPGAVMANRSSLGHEFSLRADYTVWTNFKLQGQAGWLVPTASGTDTVHEYVLQMLYSF